MSAKSARARSLWVIDNLEGLGRIAPASVGLAYLDPPFNSKRTYDAILASRGIGEEHRRRAFTDFWNWDDDAERALRRLSDLVPRAVEDFVRGLLRSLGRSDLTAYLVMMAPRLQAIHRGLADHGSLYLHCDPAASHYLKLLLDHIFGPDNFRNEIIWKRTHAHSSSRRFGPVHDVILFYSKTGRFTWNPGYSQYAASYIENYFTHADERGRYQLITCTAPGDRTGTRAHYEWRGKFPPPGRHWAWTSQKMEEFEREGRLVYSSNRVPRLKRYVGDGPGVLLQDVWLDINRLDAHSEERVGFETQKPLALLGRIIAASSNPGDTILDPFCGSGTSIVAAERAGRHWIGMDSSLLACSIALARVRQVVHLSDVNLTGFPANRSEALRVLREDPVGFGIWGTSMLATLADRRAFNGSVATGAGRLRVGQKQVQLLSWVPLRDRVEGVLPALPKGQLSKVGFVLCVGQAHEMLREWLMRNMSMNLNDVPLENLVEKQSLRRGFASRILIATRSS
ncbi:MAG: site-specific DNA-methyltransferase [Candidatus Rokubacteria bacterium]|nr:site-specific DNA-methyltransferase [Candidatus Rokubacteria bacterium]